MNLGSDCKGPCEECTLHFSGGCIAGHGDDLFTQVDFEKAKLLWISQYTDQEHLALLFGRYPLLKYEPR